MKHEWIWTVTSPVWFPLYLVVGVIVFCWGWVREKMR